MCQLKLPNWRTAKSALDLSVFRAARAFRCVMARFYGNYCFWLLQPVYCKRSSQRQTKFRNFPIFWPILPLQLAGRTDGVFLDVWVSLTSYFWVYAFSFCLLRCVFRGNWCRLRKLRSTHPRVQKQSKIPLLTVDLSTHDTSPTRQIGSPLVSTSSVHDHDNSRSV